MSLSVLLRAALLTAGLHAYIGLRLLPALSLGAWGDAAAIAALALSSLLTPAPLLMRRGQREHADLLAWAGYLCMGLFSSLFVLTVLRDLLLLGAAGREAGPRDDSRLSLLVYLGAQLLL